MNEPIFDKLIETDINLIPEGGDVTGSYFCTWWSQSAAAADLGLTGTGLSEWRDALNQDSVFGTEKYYHPAERDMRRGIIFLLDDGWDIPIGTPNDGTCGHLYGSVDPDSVKFSHFGSTPKERLRKMSEKAKEMGYAGLGLWISPQKSSLCGYDAEDDREYWEKRAEWCHSAGVLYWKVDWGRHDYDDEYRRLISDAVRKAAPGILVEHAVVQKPCTHHHPEEDFVARRTDRTHEQMSFCDAFRTYDVLEPFDKVCTLERANEALSANGKRENCGMALVNGENLYTISAALGLTVGIMNYNADAKACLNWHRIAPPFGAFESEYRASEEMLCDTAFFDTEICEWAPCKGRLVCESAPAVMARGCPLPAVAPVGGESPFVIAAKNPKTGAYSVATVRRSVDPVRDVYFLADVTVTDADPDCPLGVFGVFNSLTVEFSKIPSGEYRILAQDLTSDRALDITDKAELSGRRLFLDGRLMRYAGKYFRGHADRSEPSLVIKLWRK